MNVVKNNLKAFFADEQGAEIVEWVIVVAILAAIAVAVYSGTLGDAIKSAIDKISAIITTGKAPG